VFAPSQITNVHSPFSSFGFPPFLKIEMRPRCAVVQRTS
jgi:hypothetical protein